MKTLCLMICDGDVAYSVETWDIVDIYDGNGGGGG